MLPAKRVECRGAVLTLSCRGPIEPGYAPFVMAPFPELGGNDPRRAPTLVCLGKDYWHLAVSVQGLTAPADAAVFTAGVRPLETMAFKRGLGIRIDDSLEVSAQITLPRHPASLDFRYYSGWPEVTARIFDRAQDHEIPLRPCGAGRTAAETCWRAELPVGTYGRDWSLVLAGPDGAVDRAPGGGSYRPRGSLVHLADGELFSQEPPRRRRSPPRVETITFAAPALAHAFVVHVVLPRDFDVEPSRTYPLVYLNDGQNQLTDRGAFGGWHTDTIAARMMREGRLADCVLACVEMHPDRNRAYFPAGTLTTALGEADLYTDWLADRLFEAMQRRYRLAVDEPLTIVGSSNGAIHALSAGLMRPDRFRRVGCLSYARLRPERNFRQIEAMAAPPLERVSIDSGTRWGEGDSEEMSDDNVAVSLGLRDRLLARGMVLDGSLRYALACGDAHNEGAWRRRIGECLAFLLPPP